MAPEVEAQHTRLEHLYEISKLFTSFENVQHTFDSVLAIVNRTLPLRSAILIEAREGSSTMIVWTSDGQEAVELREVKEHALSTCAYLTGAPLASSLVNEQAGVTLLPRQPAAEGELVRRLLVIPLVVARRPAYGALQVESSRLLQKVDLKFVNAIANQLAIALDRDRARRSDVARREDAEEAVRLREQILGVVSHDLKNPLHNILVSLGTIEKEARLSPALERVQRAALRMVRLIDDLLDFASIQAGRLSIKRELHDAGAIIGETLASFEGLARQKGLELTAGVPPGLPQVYCDRDRILQVLTNLVTNATKVTAQGGHVSLQVEDRGHEIQFTVADDGPGIGKEDAKHIFERYWRSGEAKYAGSGLGLAIASGIVAAHGGRIWVVSEPGHGAKFFFTVPASDDRRRASRRSGEPARPPD